MLERRAFLAAEFAALDPLFTIPVPPAGSEIAINTHTVGSQELFPEAPCALASAHDGSFVVVWSSSGQDGSSWGVYAQRFDAMGRKRGGEFRVNQATANSQWYPSVAADADGDFVVTWTSYLQDGSQSGIYARRYNMAGTALGDEFRVNSTTSGNQRHSAVAMDDTGDFVVAWTTDGQDGSGTAACARRYDAAGAARGAEFRVNTFTAGNQQYARVASDAAGGFVIAWASAGEDGSGGGVYARRYGPDGAARGGEFRVNETSAGEQFAPTVSSDPVGGFVVTWTGAEPAGLTFDVYARAYDATGAARGGESRLNQTTTGNQAYASVAADAVGGFNVAWESDGQDGSFFGVFGRRYAPPAVAPSAVVGRYLFYNDSSFDGDEAGANAADDGAIATDKLPLFEGGAATFINYSSYGRGINGIMLDIAGLGAAAAAGAAPLLTADDFACRAGNGGDLDSWAEAAPPTSISIRPGAGASGSDRVTLTWDDDAVKNAWLQLTVKATARTRLAAADVFYFGNLIGDTGGAGDAEVDLKDVIRTRRAFSSDGAGITSACDHNRDGRVDIQDILLVRRGSGQPPLQPVFLQSAAAAAGAGTPEDREPTADVLDAWS